MALLCRVKPLGVTWCRAHPQGRSPGAGKARLPSGGCRQSRTLWFLPLEYRGRGGAPELPGRANKGSREETRDNARGNARAFRNLPVPTAATRPAWPALARCPASTHVSLPGPRTGATRDGESGCHHSMSSVSCTLIPSPVGLSGDTSGTPSHFTISLGGMRRPGTK